MGLALTSKDTSGHRFEPKRRPAATAMLRCHSRRFRSATLLWVLSSWPVV